MSKIIFLQLMFLNNNSNFENITMSQHSDEKLNTGG